MWIFKQMHIRNMFQKLYRIEHTQTFVIVPDTESDYQEAFTHYHLILNAIMQLRDDWMCCRWWCLISKHDTVLQKSWASLGFGICGSLDTNPCGFWGLSVTPRHLSTFLQYSASDFLVILSLYHENFCTDYFPVLVIISWNMYILLHTWSNSLLLFKVICLSVDNIYKLQGHKIGGNSSRVL